MTYVRISKQTKVQILSKVNSGQPIDEIHLAFIGSDPVFAADLITAAKRSGNAVFVLQLKKHMESQVTGAGQSPSKSETGRVIYLRSASGRKGKQRKITAREVYNELKHIRLGPPPPNYQPTGTTFKAFMARKGMLIDYHPNSTGKPIHFLQGGAPGQGKRA